MADLQCWSFVCLCCPCCLFHSPVGPFGTDLAPTFPVGHQLFSKAEYKTLHLAGAWSISDVAVGMCPGQNCPRTAMGVRSNLKGNVGVCSLCGMQFGMEMFGMVVALSIICNCVMLFAFATAESPAASDSPAPCMAVLLRCRLHNWAPSGALDSLWIKFVPLANHAQWRL